MWTRPHQPTSALDLIRVLCLNGSKCLEPDQRSPPLTAVLKSCVFVPHFTEFCVSHSYCGSKALCSEPNFLERFQGKDWCHLYFSLCTGRSVSAVTRADRRGVTWLSIGASGDGGRMSESTSWLWRRETATVAQQQQVAGRTAPSREDDMVMMTERGSCTSLKPPTTGKIRQPEKWSDTLEVLPVHFLTFN